MTDNEVLQHTRELIRDVCLFLEPEQKKYVAALQSLQGELSSPCVLAVAGKVKAGKSFLINALLGVDLAMTGSTETTATINVFKKGTPPSSDKPILCQWVDGREEWMPRSFLDALQGTSEDVLKQTARIDKLIFYLNDNPLLEDVTLVDTPGIGADVGDDGDAHQQHTDAYFCLRERHQQETVSLSNSADAVIYLFNTVPIETDKTFIASLYDNGNGLTALNGIGVLSKIDKNLDGLKYVDKYAGEFNKELFSIKPVSAAVSKYTPRRDQAIKLARELREGFPQEKSFRMSIGSESIFLLEKLPDCTIPAKRRKEILQEFAERDLPWSTFKLVALELYTRENVDEALDNLAAIGGIEPLRRLIYEHFFSRSRLLRIGKVLTSLMHILKDMEYGLPLEKEQADAVIKEEKKPETFSKFEECGTLSVVIRHEKPKVPDHTALQQKVQAFIKRVEKLQMEMADINNSYLAYRKATEARDQFSDDEFNELTALLTGKSSCLDCRQQQCYWRAAANLSAPNSIRQMVARIAVALYGKDIGRPGINIDT